MKLYAFRVSFGKYGKVLYGSAKNYHACLICREKKLNLNSPRSQAFAFLFITFYKQRHAHAMTSNMSSCCYRQHNLFERLNFRLVFYSIFQTIFPIRGFLHSEIKCKELQIVGCSSLLMITFFRFSACVMKSRNSYYVLVHAPKQHKII